MNEELLDTLEAFFGVGPTIYNTWKLRGGRELRVVSIDDIPGPRLTTHISYDGTLVEWPGIRAGLRLLPIVTVLTATDDNNDASFHTAHILDWALTQGVPPRAREIVGSLGHNETLPHLRYDYPFPWELESPAEIHVGELTILPILAYSVSQAEAELQQKQGPEALEELFEAKQVSIFDRFRRCAVTES